MTLFACSKTEKPKKAGIEKHIFSLISVGMNIDEARNELLKHGFKVGEKYFPTNEKNYYQMNIPLISKVPASETFRYVINRPPGNTKAYIIVTADKDGKITKIE